jgi:hypothetical protein
MAVKKNPDWHVWLGDVLYWIRTPPGIYIFIIAILGIGLAIATNRPAPPATSSPPAYVSQPAPPATISLPAPPISPPQCQLPGTRYAERFHRCIRAETGTQNNCPADFMFINSLRYCIALYESPAYMLYAGDLFFLSGDLPATIYVIDGDALAVDTALNEAYFLYPGDEITLFNTAEFRATTYTRIRITFQ